MRGPTFAAASSIATCLFSARRYGAHSVTASLLQALNDTGWTAAGQAACYWVGEAMHKKDFKDLPEIPKDVKGLAGILAANAVHLANLLQAQPYPGVPKQK
jgi:hypothetical protein